MKKTWRDIDKVVLEDNSYCFNLVQDQCEKMEDFAWWGETLGPKGDIMYLSLRNNSKDKNIAKNVKIPRNKKAYTRRKVIRGLQLFLK